MQTQSTFLRFRDGRSDKVYNVHLICEGEAGYVVNFEYGRYGATLTAGTKTAAPVPLEKATKIAEKLLNEKRGKGYSESPDGVPYEGSEKAGDDMGIRVQLLNPIDDDAQAEAYLCSPDWVMQEKYDGERGLLFIEDGQVTRTNRKGFAVAVAGEIAEIARTKLSVTGRCVLDGEVLGSTFAPFDLLMFDGQDIRDRPYGERLRVLEAVTANAVEWPKLVTCRTTEEKRAAYGALRANGAEGVVFKRITAPYSAGRPSTGGDQIKRKFVNTASCRVIDRNIDKRSVQLELLDQSTGLWSFVGNVTIPPNYPVPARGEVVEVRYLYSMRGGSLIQPTYIGARSDIADSDCTTAQLKYKGEAISEAA